MVNPKRMALADLPCSWLDGWSQKEDSSHERAVTDGAQVHPQFLPVGEGIKTSGGVVPVQAQVQREVDAVRRR